MTMAFRTIKSSIVSILGSAEDGRYQTIGFQRQVKGADEVLDNLRFVTVYFSSGGFPKSSGRNTGVTQHDITYRIELTVSKAAEADLTTLNDPNSTDTERAAAMIAMEEASFLADASLDELFDIVYQILMDPRNYDFGQPKGKVANRWVDQLQKDDPVPQGELVVITGSALLTMRASEDIVGETGTPGNGIISTTVDIEGDDVERTGVDANLT